MDEPKVFNSPTGAGVEGKSGSSSSSGGNAEIDSTSHKTVTVVVNGAGGSSSSSGGTSSTTGSGSSRVPPMSITRALLQFFLPLVMAWFGGLFADLL